MNVAKRSFVLFLILLSLKIAGYSQKKDTVIIKPDTVISKIHSKDSSVVKKDSAIKKAYNPGRASLYSAVFPGLGQIYNKKYWKVPIVWAAVGIPTYTFFDNRNWFNKTRYALAVFANGSWNNTDSFSRIDSKLKPAFYDQYGNLNPSSYTGTSLQNYRDYFRKNEDYSVLFFLLFYALNIVDATVDAHLKEFNVNSDLSISIKPDIIEGTNAAGLALVLDIHKARPKKLFDIYK
ncbi:MAG: hypothetical protein JST87_12720 [Bacteroidetes bacterium]|nr:hypothetical protein [Bacteroidota bacterium]